MRENKVQDNRLEVCFTGFNVSKKNQLIETAEAENLKTVTVVTKNLDFLVCGESAGPKKLEKAELQGVQCLTEHQFLSLIESGELPNAT